MALPLRYHWRNLFVRRTTTLLTVLVVAAVVGTLTWILAFSAALSESLSIASDARKLIIIRRGSESETNSAIRTEEFNRLIQLPGIERISSGDALISPEMMVQVSLPRSRDAGRTKANVAVRGVTETAFLVHTVVRLDGPVFSTGEPEVIVGRRASQQFAGLAVGQTIRLGSGTKRDYRVVGTFSAGGGPLESEIWGYLGSLQNAYNRQGVYSSAAVRLAPDSDASALANQIRQPPIELEAESEADYWARQSSNLDVYKLIAASLVAVISVAAGFAITNTLYSMVAGRSREIAMLRTIGFSSRNILTGFVVESVMLSLIGGILGCAGCAAWLALLGGTKDMFGARTFTSLAFQIRLTPLIVVVALLLVVVVAALGALAPALRAARIRVIDALREA